MKVYIYYSIQIDQVNAPRLGNVIVGNNVFRCNQIVKMYYKTNICVAHFKIKCQMSPSPILLTTYLHSGPLSEKNNK
jgi:hypothetical protein